MQFLNVLDISEPQPCHVVLVFLKLYFYIKVLFSSCAQTQAYCAAQNLPAE